MKVVCIGHIAYDITFPFDEFPAENTKNRAKDRVECGGGPASNAAYLLGMWGVDTTIVGVVGDDIYGKKIKEEFESVNVNTRYLEFNSEYETTSSFIIANTSIGSRTVFTYRQSTIRASNIDLDFAPDIILIDGQEPELSKKIIKQYPDAISVIDAGRANGEIVELAKMVDYVVCSKIFAENVSGIKINYDDEETIIDLYKKLEGKFNGRVVVTLESKGCLYKHGGSIKVMPSIKMKALDSTGAGDIFHGAFVYGLANKFEYEDIIRISNIAGAISVTRIGGRYSMPTKEEMKKMFYEFK